MNRIYNHIPDHFDPRDYWAHEKLVLSDIVPSTFDLRPMLMRPYDQGQVGSCTGNATAGALELDQILLFPRESAFTPDRLALYYNGRIAEGTTDQDAGAMLRDVVAGVATYGYKAETVYDESKVTTAPTQADYDEMAKRKITNMMYARVQQNVNSIKQVVYSKRGVIIGFTVYASFERIGHDGIMKMPARREQVLGGHAVLIVGYDDHKQCFIVRNSWGDTWGQWGYFYAPYAYFTNPKLASDLWCIASIVDPVQLAQAA